MRHDIIPLLAVGLFFLLGCNVTAKTSSAEQESLHTGAEQMEKILPLLTGQRVGLVVNQTSIVGPKQVHLLDTLLNRDIHVKCIFAPEHGFRGNADAGEKISDNVDSHTGLPVISLYGKNRKPSTSQLVDIDVMVFDIQDVGARFYTYISTLLNVMEACTENGKTLIVLDRPNPNDYVDGPMLEPNFRSFVGAMPIPLLHGMTIGELAQMINGEDWMQTSGKKCRLKIIPVEGWIHGQPYSLPVKPSPNLPNDTAIRLYPSLCLFEATNVSVGRGTYFPFQTIGYPDARFGKFTFIPQSLPGFDKNPLQKGKRCYGIDLRNDSTTRGFSLKYFLSFYNKSTNKQAFISRSSFFDKLAGTDKLRKQILRGDSEEMIRASWQKDLSIFRQKRELYLLYQLQPDINEVGN